MSATGGRPRISVGNMTLNEFVVVLLDEERPCYKFRQYLAKNGGRSPVWARITWTEFL